MFPSRSLKIWTRHFDRLSDLVPVPQSRFPSPNPETLAKDAAPIPNALAAIKTKKIPEIQKSVNYVETPQGDVSAIPNS